MNSKTALFALVTGAHLFAASLLSAAPRPPAGKQLIPGHVPEMVTKLNSIGLAPATNRLDLTLGLPLQNRADLDQLLQDIYNPASANFRHYLSAPEFAQRFGPAETDYEALIDFARASGFTVVETHPNRTILDVKASIQDIEKAFHVTMRVYQHPAEARTFYSPDTEPSIDLLVPVLHISGLDNHAPAQPNFRIESRLKPGQPVKNAGSGPGNEYAGKDFRAAYAPGVALNGAGQTVGLLQFDGYYIADITAYEAQFNLPFIPMQNILLNGFNGAPSANTVETCLDIEMVAAMAPGISRMYIYEGTLFDSIVNRMATDNLSKQLSSSWFQGGAYDASADQAFLQMAAQGQTFLNASGDNGARVGPVSAPSDSTNITLVGGTELSTTGPGGSWTSETTWNGSGGGVSVTYAIPQWQKGVNLSGNQGSATMRNVPDLALTGAGVYVISDNGTFKGAVGGTSVASPLMAGFIALVNQQAAALGKPPVGFLNPAIYALGGAGFHDITTGNNTNAASPFSYSAVRGYDLCTGWGTPDGMNLIDALVNFDGGVWVQFGNPNPGNGTYFSPYNTLVRGINGVIAGRTITIEGPGSSTETMTITKSLTIHSVGGPATIGH